MQLSISVELWVTAGSDNDFNSNPDFTIEYDQRVSVTGGIIRVQQLAAITLQSEIIPGGHLAFSFGDCK